MVLLFRRKPMLTYAFFPQSLKSCGYVKEQFAWRHFYWYLTNEGIQYLRDFLHLPPEIVPATLRRQTRPETARPRPKGMSFMANGYAGCFFWGGCYFDDTERYWVRCSSSSLPSRRCRARVLTPTCSLTTCTFNLPVHFG